MARRSDAEEEERRASEREPKVVERQLGGRCHALVSKLDPIRC